MTSKREPLTDREIDEARDIASNMNPYPQSQMLFMMARLGSDKEGCWNRSVRQAVDNFKAHPHLYRTVMH